MYNHCVKVNTNAPYANMDFMKSMIVAYDKNFGIGADNDLLWGRNLPADLKHFKDITSGHAVIMGYNTYKSIGRPLPGRRNIVISENNQPIDGFEVVSDLSSAYRLVADDDEIFVIGGGMVYSLAIDLADRIYATEIDASFDNASVFFPKIDKNIWREVAREKHLKDDANLYDYDFVIYERV